MEFRPATRQQLVEDGAVFLGTVDRQFHFDLRRLGESDCKITTRRNGGRPGVNCGM